MLLRQGMRYWLCLVILFYNLFFCFWDTVTRVMKVKYEVNRIYVIQVRYKLLIIGRL